MTRVRDEHPYVVRMCHWIGGLSVTILIMSGLQIFAAFPSFGDKLPEVDFFVPPAAVRLGGWLGGALQWHLTFAWLFVISGIIYFLYQIASGNLWQVLFVPRDLPGVWPMARHYFLFGPKPPQTGAYNPLQKLAYTSVLGLGVVAAVTGAALYKPVQLSWVVDLLGGFRLTRVWHFAAMAAILGFIPGHLVMVALHGWANFASMWTGQKRGAREGVV
jgi:thiosulfate reductase cytochrome b subunit